MASSLCSGVDKAALRFTHKLKQLQRRMGLSRRELAENIGINERTVKEHLAGQRPCHDHLLAYFEYFGPELVNEWIAPIGLTGAHFAEGEEICGNEIVAEATKLAHLISTAKSENSPGGTHVTHQELPEIHAVGMNVINLISKAILGRVK